MFTNCFCLSPREKRVEQLAVLEGKSSDQILVQSRQDTSNSKRQEVLDAITADRLLAFEEVEFAQRLVKDCSEALHGERMQIESNTRHGIHLLGERNRLSRELEACRAIQRESEENRRLLLEEANILRQDMRTCEAGLRSTEKENSVVRPLVEEMTAKVASAVNHAIATGEFSPLEFHVADCLTPSLFWRATLWASERKAADPKNARARAREPPAT